MKNEDLIAQLYLCLAECLDCRDKCSAEKEHPDLMRCMMLDEDCAGICRLTATALERNSENVDLFLKLCAEICDKCATECEKHSNMRHCKRCAEECRKCSEMCSQMEPA